MPNPFDEYINKLEGASEIDPLEVVRDLRKLHTEEIGIRESKITELNGFVADRDEKVTNLSKEITVQKAKNYDLVNEIPNPNDPGIKPNDDGNKPDASTIKISDIFKKDVSKRHGL